jgi:Ca-activated chloride channel family protein
VIQDFELASGARVWIHLVWAAPLVLLLLGWSLARRARTLAVFGHDPARSAEWLASLRRRRWRRAAALAAAVLFLAAAAVQPRLNPEKTTYKTSARDIAVIVDVSKSMLASDLAPSRLERAKLELGRLLTAERMKGDRIGIIAFAGDAVIKCPLTSNYSYVQSVVKTLSPQSASQGGTRIGDAIRKALSDLLGADRGQEAPAGAGAGPGETVMEDELRGKKETFADILLITDGEDMDSYPVEAAKQAARVDVGIYAVGLGSEQGSPIPVRGEGGAVEYLRKPDGEVVSSRLDSRTLHEMVNMAPRGQYLPVGTLNLDLVDFYEGTLDKESGREVVEEQVFWTEIFQPFLLAGLVFYLAHLLLPERPRRGRLALEEGST